MLPALCKGIVIPRNRITLKMLLDLKQQTLMLGIIIILYSWH